MRVGLVLGAGGVVGASWLIGALEALESETGWRAKDAEVIIGTSAGSVIGTLTAAGIPPAYMSAHSSGRTLAELDPLEGAELELDEGSIPERETAERYRFERSLPPVGPGSWRMAVSTLRNPLRHTPSALMAGWLPRGVVSTAPISGLVEGFVAGDWPAHPGLWVVACDYRTGRRVAFGREGAPPARIGQAVAASCAIPAFYHPVCIDGRRYVDGGVCSMSNVDLFCDQGLDAVVVLNPTSSLATVAGRSPGERLAAAMRASSGRRLGHELRKLRETGTEVVCVQPTAEDLAAMGPNLMARDRRLEVMQQAVVSTARELRAHRETLPKLTGTRRARRRRTAAESVAEAA